MSALRRWFVTSWCGDFRLERVDDASCRLTVENPTLQDQEALGPFLAHAVRERWIETVPLFVGGTTELIIPQPIAVMGPVLAGIKNESWTVVKGKNGQITLGDGPELPTKEPEPEAAVTTQRPGRGCPMPVRTNYRASEVLRTFCTPRQQQDFARHHAIQAVGCATGERYTIWHRDEAARRGLSRSITKANGNVICAWDASVPAEEEMLSLKFAVEHRESWLLQVVG